MSSRFNRSNNNTLPHTSKFAPWYRETTIAFRDKKKIACVLYLKIGTGRAYAIKHFLLARPHPAGGEMGSLNAMREAKTAPEPPARHGSRYGSF